MSTFDKTFCTSPNCKNECGRKMSEEIKKSLLRYPWYPVSHAYLYGEPEPN